MLINEQHHFIFFICQYSQYLRAMCLFPQAFPPHLIHFTHLYQIPDKQAFLFLTAQ